MLYPIKRFTALVVPLGAALLLGPWAGGAAAQVVADDVDCSQCVGKGDIADKAVTARKIKSNSIFSPKIINRSIQGVDIGLGAVGTQEIADGAITLDKLSPDVADALAGSAATVTVDCSAGDSIQDAVDTAISGRGTTIFIEGTCTEDVTIEKDDIVLSGNEAGATCNKANPSASADATIDGTITVEGVRARIEHLEITGSGEGVTVINRADADLVCNDIANNAESGVGVIRSSNAILRNNTVRDNGKRSTNPNIFFDCGLYVTEASSVRSYGNTYKDNQYCAVASYWQSLFRSGDFLPREAGNPANPDERDVITEIGCDPATGTGCFTDDFGPVAIDSWTHGSVELRNAEVNGEIRSAVQSTFRIDGDGAIQGNIVNEFTSMVRIENRFDQFGDRSVSFNGTLSCIDQSQTFFSDVDCGQTCSGNIPSTCIP